MWQPSLITHYTADDSISPRCRFNYGSPSNRLKCNFFI